MTKAGQQMQVLIGKVDVLNDFEIVTKKRPMQHQTNFMCQNLLQD